MFKKLITIAALYFIAGKLALLLSIPPGYATAVWPSAGIALAFVIRYGYRLWPGVLLGSFLVNIGTSFNGESLSTILSSVGLAAVIGLGAAFQALAGAYLVRRYVPSMELIKPGFVAKFFLLGGLIACLVSPTCGVLALMANGIIQWPNAPVSWLTWWVGDSIGVFLFTPLLFLWIGEPRDTWQARRYYLIIPLIIVFGVVILTLNLGYRIENKQIEDAFHGKVHVFKKALEYKIEEFYVALDSVYGFYASSQHVDREEFEAYVLNLIPSLPQIKSVAWVPKINREERDEFVSSVREEGIEDYQIKDVTLKGALIEAQERDVYYPLLYLEPLQNNKKALGIDNGSEPTRRQAMELALQSGTRGSSAPLTLAQDRKTGLKSVLLTKAVYKKETPIRTFEDRKKNVVGFITITTKVDDIIRQAFKTSSYLEDIKFTITDVSEEGSVDVYTHVPAGKSLEEKIRSESMVDLAGRSWFIVFHPTVDFYTQRQTWILWFIIVGTFLLATLLNILFLITTGQTIEIRRTVDEKTKELKKEINLHKKTTDDLSERGKELEDSHIAALNIMQDAQEAKVKAEKAEAAARRALNVKSEFTSMVSHELRTPLTVIKESVAIVYDGTAGSITDDQKEFLETAKRNVDRLARLINDVLDYQKLDAQQMEFRTSKGDINETVREAGESFQTSLTNKGIGLDIKLAPDLPAINFDKDKIIQVMINLINNAMKFTEKGNIVLMTERLSENAIKVSVKDSGIGIKPEDMGKLFESFSQISTGTSRQPGGTGLGLALCKKIVECHNGKIDVESVFGEGSVFYFILPIVERRSSV